MYLLKEAELNQSKKAARVYRALNHTLRQRMLFEIDAVGKGGMRVTDLFVKLRMEQSVASQHLAVLRKAGLVFTERTGKFIAYRVDYKKLAEVKNITAQLIK